MAVYTGHSSEPTLPPPLVPNHPPQFVAVYDGHSSHHGSEHASRRVHQYIAAQPAVQQCKVRGARLGDVLLCLQARVPQLGRAGRPCLHSMLPAGSMLASPECPAPTVLPTRPTVSLLPSRRVTRATCLLWRRP